MKGQWCIYNPKVFCTEDSGCQNCEIYMEPWFANLISIKAIKVEPCP